ncbi:hypothetical protein PV326_001441, partial [Microctonus aethiopoides]
MEARYGFPGVIGMVDGTHIPISAPKIDKQVYINHQILLPDEVDYLGPLDETNESKATGAAKR